MVGNHVCLQHGLDETDLYHWLNEQVWVALLIQQVITGLSDVLGQGRNSADIDGVTCSNQHNLSA